MVSEERERGRESVKREGESEERVKRERERASEGNVTVIEMIKSRVS